MLVARACPNARLSIGACAEKGLTAYETAKKLGVTVDAVWKQSSKYVVRFKRTRRVITDDVVLQAMDLRKQGVSFTQIGKLLGFHGPAINVAIERYKDRLPPEMSGDDASIFVIETTPVCRVALSLMSGKGFSREKAIEAAAIYRKALARKEASAATPAPVVHVNTAPFRLGQSLHAHTIRHGDPACPGPISREIIGEHR